VKLLADENIPQPVVHGVLLRHPDADFVRVQEVGLTSAPDEAVLRWAAENDRIVVTYDVSTVLTLAYERVAKRQRMPGVVAIRWSTPWGQAIEDLLIFIGASREGEWENRVLHLPL
jgi:predicted nuclease of predicted toxin-antitoxin system